MSRFETTRVCAYVTMAEKEERGNTDSISDSEQTKVSRQASWDWAPSGGFQGMSPPEGRNQAIIGRAGKLPPRSRSSQGFNASLRTSVLGN